jgi:hypothetical protein
MSHFAVLVIGDNPEKQLEPYNEQVDVPRYVKYTKRQLIEKERAALEIQKADSYDKYMTDPEEYKKSVTNERHLTYLENEFMKDYNRTDEEVYQHAIRFYEPGDIGPKGEVYSTYNPKSKWDWYQIGGRYSGILKLKAKVTPAGVEVGEHAFGERSWCNEKEPVKPLTCDQARFGDLDFSNDDEYDKYARQWEMLVEGSLPRTKEEREWFEYPLHYNKGYLLEKYKDKETYIKLQSAFGTFAVLKNGEWFEKGEMGWFGMSSDTAEEANKWESEFYDRFLNGLPADTLITVVDCHI